MKLEIYNLEDRLEVAKILVKNGYTVTQVKKSVDYQKSPVYCLNVEEEQSEDSIKCKQ